MDSYIVPTNIALNLKSKYLNLGCGTAHMDGWTNVDLYPGEGVDVVLDLDQPVWPWADGSIKEIFSAHTIEHVKDHIHFMKECHRILAPGGYCSIRCPFGFNEAAMGDPTHQRPFFPWTFAGFAHGYDIHNTRSQQHHPSRWNFSWDIIEMAVLMSDWVQKLPFYKLYSTKLMYILNNVGSEIRVVYKKPL